MDVLGVIPARGGSKGLPGKNLLPLAGRPLITYTCAAALASRHLTRVVVSTDDEEIAATARRAGVDVPFLRPAELAADETPILPVIQDTLHRLHARDAAFPDIVVLLQPTSPLRRAEHIDAAVAKLAESDADSVVSVVTVPHRYSPGSLMRLAGERLVPASDGPAVLRRQDKPVVYARNGPAVLAVRTRVLLEQDSLYGAAILPLIMDEQASVDIDTQADLDFAAFLLQTASA